MQRTITWSTGAPDTAEGQVITARCNFATRRVIFHDHSRMIAWVCRSLLPPWIDHLHGDDALRCWVMIQYDGGEYDYVATGNADRLQRQDGAGEGL